MGTILIYCSRPLISLLFRPVLPLQWKISSYDFDGFRRGAISISIFLSASFIDRKRKFSEAKLARNELLTQLVRPGYGTKFEFL